MPINGGYFRQPSSRPVNNSPGYRDAVEQAKKNLLYRNAEIDNYGPSPSTNATYDKIRTEMARQRSPQQYWENYMDNARGGVGSSAPRQYPMGGPGKHEAPRPANEVAGSYGVRRHPVTLSFAPGPKKTPGEQWAERNSAAVSDLARNRLNARDSFVRNPFSSQFVNSQRPLIADELRSHLWSLPDELNGRQLSPDEQRRIARTRASRGLYLDDRARALLGPDEPYSGGVPGMKIVDPHRDAPRAPLGSRSGGVPLSGIGGIGVTQPLRVGETGEMINEPLARPEDRLLSAAHAEAVSAPIDSRTDRSAPSPGYVGLEAAPQSPSIRTGRDYLTHRAQLKSAARLNRMAGLSPQAAHLLALQGQQGQDFANMQAGLAQSQMFGDRQADALGYNRGLYGDISRDTLTRDQIASNNAFRNRQLDDRSQLLRQLLGTPQDGGMADANAATGTRPSQAGGFGNSPANLLLALSIADPELGRALSPLASAMLESDARTRMVTDPQMQELQVWREAQAAGQDPASAVRSWRQMRDRNAPIIPNLSVPRDEYGQPVVDSPVVDQVLNSLPSDLTPEEMLAELSSHGISRAHLEDYADEHSQPSLWDRMIVGNDPASETPSLFGTLFGWEPWGAGIAESRRAVKRLQDNRQKLRRLGIE